MQTPIAQDISQAVARALIALLDILPYLLAALVAADRKFKLLDRLIKKLTEKEVAKQVKAIEPMARIEGGALTLPPETSSAVFAIALRGVDAQINGLEFRITNLTNQQMRFQEETTDGFTEIKGAIAELRTITNRLLELTEPPRG